MTNGGRDSDVATSTAYAMLISVMVLWSSGVVVARGVHTLVPPIGFSFWRWATAGALLLPLAARPLWRHRHELRGRLRGIALLGLFMAGGSTLLVWAVQYTTAINVALVSATQPVVTMMAAWLMLGERVRGQQWVGAMAAVCGILIMVARMDLAVLLDLAFNPGDVLVLLAVVFYACYSVKLHVWLGGLPPQLVMFLTAAGGLLVLAPFYVAETWTVRAMSSDGVVMGAVVFMAVVPTLAATTMWNISVGVVGPSRASIFINLLPVFGGLMAVVFLGEQLALYHVLGVVLVSLGITLVVRAA